jgi:prepilin-type N-terminal cleavage/methylation domain-containing protein
MNQRGYTLFELILVIVLGLFAIGAITGAFLVLKILWKLAFS